LSGSPIKPPALPEVTDSTDITTISTTASTITVAGGWQYALVKYDGPNAGSVLFFLPTFGNTLPNYPFNFWTTNTTQWNVSGYVLYNSIPVPDGGLTVMLLGLGVGGLALFSRKFKR
jgi:hypothetical protein